MRLRRLLLAAIAVVALALVPATAGAEFVTLGSADQNQALVGPTFAGPEVVWGERTIPGTSRSELSVLAAVPGAHGSTLFSTPPLSSIEDEIDPLGLVASPTRIAFAYQVEAPECGPMSGACGLPDLREVLSAAAFGGPLDGPFRKLAGAPLKNGAIGLSGEELVLAEPAGKGEDFDNAYLEDLASGAPARDVGKVSVFGVSVAGSYMASSGINEITVTTLAGTPVYSVLVPSTDAAECTPDSNGVGRDPESERPTAPCGYALGADGMLAIAGSEPAGLYWASPAQPQLHPIAVTLASHLVAIANDEIVYLSPAGAHDAQLSLTNLSGGTRPISSPIDGGGEAVSGLAFNGTSVAWADHCVYAGSVPAGAPSAPPNPACEAVTIQPGEDENATVAAGGHVRIALTCQYSPCTGSLTMTSVLDKSIGKGGHRKLERMTVTIATGSFTALPVSEAATVSLSLTRRGLSLLRQSRDRLSATVTATLPLASTSQKTSATVSLHASRPRRHRPA
jgi:hypothetical protein